MKKPVPMVVCVSDVGDDGVVDYGALGSHAEGVGGVTGVESHVVLHCVCGRKVE